MTSPAWLLARAKEPSIHASLSGLALTPGLSDAEWAAVGTAAAALFGAVAVVIAEHEQ